MQVERVVIAGAGLAGLRTAEELRGRGYPGAITMVGAELWPPYDRPPLTKKFMTGQLDDTTLAADPAALALDLRLGEAATGLDGGVLLTDRGEHAFDALVLATGAAPVGLPGGGGQRFLRTFDDARALRDALRPGTRLAVVGAGWIGAELATTAPARGCQVTVVEAAAGPARRGARGGRGVGDRALVRRRREWICCWASRWNPLPHDGLVLPGGGWLPADLTVVAVGVRPQVGWLAGSPVRLENGVAVDGRLRTSAPGVYAAGDCAAFVSARYGRRLRVEHWDNALHAPRVVAANILGGDEAYDPVPYFWSEQFGRMVQYAGHHSDADRLIWRGDPADREWAVCWLAGPGAADGAGERLVALLTVGVPGICSRAGASSRRAGRSIPAVSPTRASRSATPCPLAPDGARVRRPA